MNNGRISDAGQSKEYTKGDIDETLVENLLQYYSAMKIRFLQEKYEECQLSAGKFCEFILRILRNMTGTDITNLDETLDHMAIYRSLRSPRVKGLSAGLRFQIPAVVKAVYSFRSHRSVAHGSLTIKPSFMDASFAVAACDWIMTELVRIKVTNDPDQANQIIQFLIQRRVPLIQEFGS